jgi:putative membrane protein
MRFGKHVTLVVWLTGMSVLVGLTVWSGADQVGHAIVSAGLATGLVVIARIVAVAGAGAGWWLLFPSELQPSLRICVLLRFVREATNALLPLAQIGGDFIGARCLALRGVRGTLAAASVIVDVLLQAATQLVFAIVGLVLLVAMGGSELVAWPVAIGIAIAIPALGGFFMMHGERGQRIVKNLLNLVARDREWLVFGAIDDLFLRLGVFYSNRRGLARSAFWHLFVWFIGATEVWVVMLFMGYPVTFEQAVIIESLMHAVRGAAFAVPGALGAQEGGLIVLCAIFGVPPEAALALSLVKRIPDLVIGVPGLMAWQAMEGWHFHSTRRRTADNQNERA